MAITASTKTGSFEETYSNYQANLIAAQRGEVMTAFVDDKMLLPETGDDLRELRSNGLSSDETASEPEGKTALIDAVYLALNAMRKGRHANRCLLVLSDGYDNGSVYTSEELGRLPTRRFRSS